MRLLGGPGVLAVSFAYLGGSQKNFAIQKLTEQLDVQLIVQRNDGRTCRDVVENDRKIIKCCKTWIFGVGADCVYN